MRVDVAEAGGLIGTVILLARPTWTRAAAAGVLLGLTILAKEAVGLAIVLPAAWLGTIQMRRVALLWAVFLACVVGVAGWWWLYVFVQTGALFPLNILPILAERDVRSEVELARLVPGGVSVAVGALILLGWAAFAAQRWRDPRSRLVLLAGLAVVPVALLALIAGLHARQLAPLVILSTVACAVAVSDLAGPVLRRIGATRQPSAVSVAALLLVAAIAGQLAAPGTYRTDLSAAVAGWLAGRLRPGESVVATLNERSYLAVALYRHGSVRVLPVDEIGPRRDPSTLEWIGVRGTRLLGLPSRAWSRVLGSGDVRYLVLTGPNDFSPTELLPMLDRRARSGLERLVEFTEADRTATIFGVDPTTAARGLAGPPTTSPAGLTAWLALAGPDAAERIARSGAIVVGDPGELDLLASRLPSALCMRRLDPRSAELLTSRGCGRVVAGEAPMDPASGG
jgi:hypothetical protein